MNPALPRILVLGLGLVLDGFTAKGGFDSGTDGCPGVLPDDLSHLPANHIAGGSPEPFRIGAVAPAVAAVRPDVRNQRRAVVDDDVELLEATLVGLGHATLMLSGHGPAWQAGA